MCRITILEKGAAIRDTAALTTLGALTSLTDRDDALEDSLRAAADVIKRVRRRLVT